MTKNRLEAFSDGVFAIIITIMVLELKPPQGQTFSDLLPLAPMLLGYLLSFIYVGIYWNNHHHLFQVVKEIKGWTLWANLHLLFWLSLMPFVTAWASSSHFQKIPVMLYGVDLLMCGASYTILVKTLLKNHDKESTLAKALGKDTKGNLSILFYLIAVIAACKEPFLSCALYVIVAMIWIVPDTRIESRMK